MYDDEFDAGTSEQEGSPEEFPGELPEELYNACKSSYRNEHPPSCILTYNCFS